MSRNLALGFIKPHASDSVKVWDVIQSSLTTHQIHLSSESIITGPDIRSRGLIDRHYAAIARIGGGDNPASLPLDQKAMTAFETAFGISWKQAVSQGLVFSGMAALQRLSLTPMALMALWSTAKASKISSGFYAAPIQGLYVLNGFYPSIREIYTTDTGFIRVFLMEFDGNKLPWKSFRAEVIGSTDPSKAPPSSIRGSLFQKQDALGLRMDSRDNVIHASASPLEAMVERSIWMPAFDLNTDPLMQAMAGIAITRERVLALIRENPIKTLGSRTASVIDHCEDTDTPTTATLLQQLA